MTKKLKDIVPRPKDPKKKDLVSLEIRVNIGFINCEEICRIPITLTKKLKKSTESSRGVKAKKERKVRTVVTKPSPPAPNKCR